MKSKVGAILFLLHVLLGVQAKAQHRIMALGNSITQSNSSYKSYRYPLWQKLVNAKVSFDFVGSMRNNSSGNPIWPDYQGQTFDQDHEGHWGWRADEILNGKSGSAKLSDWLQGYMPDIVLLHLGTNDLIQGQGVNSTLEDLRQVVGVIRAKNPKVIVLLAKLIPSNTNTTWKAAIEAFNVLVPALAVELHRIESPVLLVDQFSGYNSYLDNHDGLHPNALGEEKMATKWFEALWPVIGSNIQVPPALTCTATGTILREQWNNVSGTSITAIPLNNPPASTSQLTLFEAPSNTADNYGSRIRGYICAPATGNYTFYIAGDDDTELWLSTDENAANKKKIAGFSGWTNVREWTKYATQKSATMALQANTRYYIEALHKEGNRSDHVSVGWITPGASGIAVIPGTVLSPFTITANSAPTVSITSPAANATFTAPATLNLTANAADTGGNIVKVEFFNGTAKLGEDFMAPYAYSWTGIAAGTYSITVKATDNLGLSTTSTPISVTVKSTTSGCTANGSILREYWTNVTGASASSIPVTTTPASTAQLTSFEAPSNVADYYGQRIRGYICAPATGNYTFYIAGDDNAELWLSTNDNPAAKQKIAFSTTWTSPRQWTKYASQKSAVITLQANTRYYIEALHKEGNREDHLAVGWLTPGSSVITVIPGAVLSPVTAITASSITSISKPNSEPEIYVGTGKFFRSYPNPFTNKITIAFAFDQEEVYKVLIYNVSGSLVKAFKSDKAGAKSLVQIEWADEKTAAGLYLVRLVTSSGVQTLQIVRE